MSVVHYKFKNNLDYKTLSFDGLSISLGDFKQAIMSQNRTKGGEYDLEVTNAQSKEAYTENATQIPKNASVIIRRIPVGPKGKALTAAERPQSPADGKPNEDEGDTPVVPLSKLNKVGDLASANASEEDKIAAMMSQAGENWNPALYAKPKGRQFNVAPRHPPPPHYMCFRCRKPGHWIQNCPTNTDPNYDLKNRRTTGIPKSFLRIAEKPTQKGALLIPDTGQYAVPIVDHNAYEEAALKKRPNPQSGPVENEKPIPPEYFCPICKKIMNNAVVLPCCCDSCCDTCIEKSLLENEHVCPLCQKEDVSPASVVINKHLRQAIIKIRSSGFQGGSLSATLSPSAHRDGDQGRSTPVGSSSVTTSTSVEPSTTTTTLPSHALTTETSKPAQDTSGSGTATPTTSTTQTTPVVSQEVVAPAIVLPATTVPQGVLPHVPHVALPHATILDPRLQRPDGIVQPMAVPHPPAPVHRTAYVTAPTYHAHHPALVHPTVPSIPSTYHGRISHPALVPTRPNALPFTNLDAGHGMMTEEEFYRAKKKVQERGRRKRRKDDDERKSRKKDRSRSRRDRRESPSSRRSPSDVRARKRSRSWTRSGSSSQSSWSHSWSKSPSRSYSRSKSRTPVNWDRSRSPSVERRGKTNRVEESKKRKKQDSKDSKKRSKVDNEPELSEKRTTKSEKLISDKKKSKTDDVNDSVVKTKSKGEKMKPENDDKVSEKKTVKTEQNKNDRKKPKVVDVVDDSLSGKANIKAVKEKSKTNEGGYSKETKKRSNVVENVDKKLDNKKSKIHTKDGKRKSKLESDEEDLEAGKSVNSKKNVDVKKGASRAGSTASETRSSKVMKSDERKKLGRKKPIVKSDDDFSSSAEQNMKSSRESKKKYLRESDDSDFELQQNVKTAKSFESKRVVKKKSKPEDVEGSFSSAAKQGDKKEKEANSGFVKNSKSDIDVNAVTLKKSSVRTVKYNDSRAETEKKLKSDEIKKSERKVAVKKRSSKVDLDNVDMSVKKSDISIVRKCSLSDLRDIVNKNSDKTADNVEKSSKLKKNTGYKEVAKNYATETSDVSRTKEKDLRDLMQSRKKNVFNDERKLLGKTNDGDGRAAGPMAERKRKTEHKRDSEDLRDIQKTAKTAVKKTKDKKSKEPAGDSLPVEEKCIGRSSKISRHYQVKREVKINKDNLKKTNRSGDIREVSLKTSHKGKISVDKIKQKDSDVFLRDKKRVKESSTKSRKYSVSDESETSDSDREVRKESRRREGRTKKARMSFSDESDDERRRVHRKRSKDDDDVFEKSKKKKKKRSSVSEGERKDGRHKKRKHKKKHKKHKHKKKSKRKERKRSEEVYSSDEVEYDDSDNELVVSDDEDGTGSERDDGLSGAGSEKDGSESGADEAGMFVGRESSETTQSESENGNESDQEENYKSTADSLKVEVNSESGDVSDDDIVMPSESDVVIREEVEEDKVERLKGVKEDLDIEEEELDYDEDLDEDMEQDNCGEEGILDDDVVDKEGQDEIEMSDEDEQEFQDDEESEEEVEMDNDGEEIGGIGNGGDEEEHKEESAEEVEEEEEDSEIDESGQVDMEEEETEELEDEEDESEENEKEDLEQDDGEENVGEEEVLEDSETSEEEQEDEDIEVEEMGEIELENGVQHEEEGIEMEIVSKDSEIIEAQVDSQKSDVVEVEDDEQEKHSIEVEADEIENEEALLADDGDHESLPGDEFHDESMLRQESAEHPVGDDLYDEALLRDYKDDTDGNEELTSEIFGDADGDDGVNDVDNNVSNKISNEVSNDVDNDVHDGVSYDASNIDDVIDNEGVGDREGASKGKFDKINMEETASQPRDSVEESTDSQVSCNSDSNVVELSRNKQQDNFENKTSIDDFRTKPLAQSSNVARRGNSHNNGRSMSYARSQDNSFGSYPSYDSGIGTTSSLESVFDEFEDINYTSFGHLSETPRT